MSMNRMTWKAAAAAVCAALALAGCMEAALIGGAAGAGVLLYNGDRRSSETSQADSALEKAGEEAHRVTAAMPEAVAAWTAGSYMASATTDGSMYRPS